MNGCRVRNIFTFYYTDLTNGKSLEQLKCIPASGPPNIFQVSNALIKEKELLENNYMCQGYSGFPKSGNMDQLLVHSKKIRASDVVISTNVVPTGWYINKGTGGPTYGIKTFASFWNKYATPRTLGVMSRNLNDEEKKRSESNKGVAVELIVKNTPAYENDIIVGDIILKINSEIIVDNDSFIYLVKKYRGTQIDIEIFRNREIINKTITLNK
jgi:hypothetical protein